VRLAALAVSTPCLNLKMEGKTPVGNSKPAVKKFQKVVKDVNLVRRHTQQFAILASKYTDLLEIISTHYNSLMLKRLQTYAHIEITLN